MTLPHAIIDAALIVCIPLFSIVGLLIEIKNKLR